MQKKKSNSRTLRWVGGICGRTKLNIGLLVLVQIFLGVSGVILALVLRSLVNCAVAGDQAGFLRAAVLLGIFILLQIAVSAAERFLEEHSKATIENRLKHELLRNILFGNYSAVSAVHSGEWMNRMTSDTVVVADGAVTIVPGITGMIIKLASALAAILVLEPGFALILIPGGLLLVVLSYAFRKVLKRLHKGIQEADGSFRIFTTEHIGSLPIVKTYAGEEGALLAADNLMGQHKAARMKRNHFSNLCNVGFALGMRGVYILGAIYCGYGILTGSMSYGNFTAVLQLINQIQSPFANITGFLPKYYAMLASAERLMEAGEHVQEDMFGHGKEARDNMQAQAEADTYDFYPGIFAGVALEHLEFSYDTDNPVLQDFSLQVGKGEYIAFTGPSGCGKSTVLKLLLGLYKPACGDIYIKVQGGKNTEADMELLPLARARHLFAYVPQGNLLMNGTIRSVVTFADPLQEKNEERIRRALEIACGEFVYELPEGLDTALGERGAGLSEGQMQRLAIARAIFSENPVLLLDEATSALDGETEKKLLENLRNMTDKTVIIVTHRMAALQVCDREVNFGEA